MNNNNLFDIINNIRSIENMSKQELEAEILRQYVKALEGKPASYPKFFNIKTKK